MFERSKWQWRLNDAKKYVVVVTRVRVWKKKKPQLMRIKEAMLIRRMICGRFFFMTKCNLYFWFIIFPISTAVSDLLRIWQNHNTDKILISNALQCLLPKWNGTEKKGHLKKYFSIFIHSFFFISNTANSQPVANLRFLIVVACDCCLISKNRLWLLLSF